ncbi:hypothetical protein J2810_002774 [Chryseobacterium rhizosphaerae]|uniref:hypothetical protein n=1 Tax=Chryseobacterium rhizosphaerae TaxID=395937 RepID=UPI00285DAAC9|nr:hypothetical protein [Chryseobacterium rhizosphaerae]MDR6546668.1 hypothetical protein [Chryseobacterium rhizosphaerae]MDR6546714.1 hypothetical protein [Chryseobacterium rhizosphaerae]
MLTNFFRINLPYGIAKNDNDEWMAFNREYMPLGFNDVSLKEHVGKSYHDKPIYTKYNSITEKLLLELSFDGEKGVRRDSSGKIEKVFLYDDGTNPSSGYDSKNEEEKMWNDYFQKLKKISELRRKI